MTPEEKIVREKAAYFVIGLWPEVARQAPLRPDVFVKGKEYILAIIPTAGAVYEEVEPKPAVKPSTRPRPSLCEHCDVTPSAFKTPMGTWACQPCYLERSKV